MTEKLLTGTLSLNTNKHVLSHVSATQFGCLKYLYYGKNSDSTGGCYTPHTHAAIDRTLTTVLVSFPNETSTVLHWSYWKKLPAFGWAATVCPVTYRYRESDLNCMRGLYTSAIYDHTSTCYFIAIIKTSHLGQWMVWHFIRLFDWRTHVLIQIVSEYGSPSTCNPSHAT